MAKGVRISDQLYRLAQLESVLENRSLAQQIEYWAKLGMASRRVGETRAEYVDSLEASLQATRRLDIADVQDGKRSAESLHFIPASLVREAELEFPAEFTYKR